MGFDKEASSSSHVLQIPPNHHPREDSPLISKSNNHLSSQSKTFANVFIAIVGAGVLGLPYTFRRTGWVMGLIMLFVVSYLTYHCMMLLVYTRRKLESLKGRPKIASFGDLGFVVCGPVGRAAVDIMIVLSQAGFCISYLIFIATTLVNIFNYSPESLNPTTPMFIGIPIKTLYIWACFPFQLGLNSIPTLTHLAPLSIFADVVDLGAIGTVMVEDVITFLNRRPELHMFGGFSVFFYGLGVAVYAFEGVGMVLPIESETRDKHKFGRILGLSMAFISTIYGAFGALGYFAFGDETKDIITTNLGRGWISSVVQIGLCVNLFFTFPLMMNPVYEVVERRFFEARYCMWGRWIVVLGVSLVALLVPNFADFLSLVGSSVCIVLGFVLPALFHLIVYKEEMSVRGLVLDGAIVLIGVVLGVSGTWSSLVEIFGTKA
ncbi:amino acid transporter AVT3B-like [Impatiens glandulifera]|uniref:amino acid transporter AVT3B-like n=1 Tax=Impatiens glandulifera TaxID=253017 RepID=UPI001FB09DA0|nr:amino acid transporter AVT3B-like [Impatiens glandulifera]